MEILTFSSIRLISLFFRTIVRVFHALFLVIMKIFCYLHHNFSVSYRRAIRHPNPSLINLCYLFATFNYLNNNNTSDKVNIKTHRVGDASIFKEDKL